MKHDELHVPERYINQPHPPSPLTRPAPWTDFKPDMLQRDRVVAPSTLQSERARCQAHDHRLSSSVTRWGPKFGNVARCEYHGCDCVEYRPVKKGGGR